MIYKDSIPDFVLLSNSDEENSNNVNPKTLTGISVLMLVGILIVLLVFNFINYKKVKV